MSSRFLLFFFLIQNTHLTIPSSLLPFLSQYPALLEIYVSFIYTYVILIYKYLLYLGPKERRTFLFFL